MRLGEILGLRWEWIDLKDNFMTERYVHPEESVREATEIVPNLSKRVTDKFTDIDEGK